MHKEEIQTHIRKLDSRNCMSFRSETCPKGYKVNQTSLSPLVPEDAMPLTAGGRRNES